MVMSDEGLIVYHHVAIDYEQVKMISTYFVVIDEIVSVIILRD